MSEPKQCEKQPMILIIDDRPEIGDRVRWAVAEWRVEEARNGAAGMRV